jgi:ribonuclease P protein subunit RPR2
MSRSQPKEGIKAIALERIELLLEMARKEVKAKPERAKRYVGIARKLATRYRVRPSKGLKRSFCKFCFTPWVPGYNLEVRLEPRSGCAVYKCSCGHERRFRYKTAKLKD